MKQFPIYYRCFVRATLNILLKNHSSTKPLLISDVIHHASLPHRYTLNKMSIKYFGNIFVNSGNSELMAHNGPMPPIVYALVSPK